MLALWMRLDFAQRPQQAAEPETGLPGDSLARPHRPVGEATSSRVAGAMAGTTMASMPAVGHDRAPHAAVPASASAAQPVRLKPGEVDICGVGIRQGEALEIPDAPPALRASMPQLAIAPLDVVSAGLPALWQLLGRTMRASPDLRQQAAALAMDLPAEGKPYERGSSDLSRQLRDLALRTNDPLILQWSVQRCVLDRNPSCLHASARQWVRAEPDNLSAWLALLAEEPSAQAEALHGMALARFSDLRDSQLAWRIEAAIPEVTPAYLRMTALMQSLVLGIVPQANSAVLSKLCDPSVLGDANRRQQCDAIAHVLIEHGHDGQSYMQGITLANHLAWPASYRASLAERVGATRMQGAVVDTFDLAQPYSCASIAAMRRRIKAEAGQR